MARFCDDAILKTLIWIYTGKVLWPYCKVTNLQGSEEVVEKAVDCLRILTTDSEENKLALFTVKGAVASLTRLMTSHDNASVPCLCFGLSL